MCRYPAVLLLLGAAWLAAPAGAQPDRSAALAKAKAKFEADVSKAEDALIANIDRALKAAGANKATAEKLTYEREMFVTHRLVPTAVPTAAYLKQRSQAIAALDAVYLPAIKELAKAKKDEEAVALESALSDLLKTARGYGLALPDLESRPTFFIENKATGLVVDPAFKDSDSPLTLTPKAAAKKASQGWLLERDEKGFVVRHKDGVIFPRPPRAEMWYDPKKEVPDRAQFQLTEVRREVVFAARPAKGGGGDGFVLAVAERKVKGVTVYDVVMEKKESPPTPNQLWALVEVK
jgi:hypothetical protein